MRASSYDARMKRRIHLLKHSTNSSKHILIMYTNMTVLIEVIQETIADTNPRKTPISTDKAEVIGETTHYPFKFLIGTTYVTEAKVDPENVHVMFLIVQAKKVLFALEIDVHSVIINCLALIYSYVTGQA